MFLEKLSEFAGQIDLPPPMYQSTPVRYVIELDADGSYINIKEFVDGKNKATISRNAPFCKRSSGIKPKLLVDNGEYTLGIGREKSDPRRVQEQHIAYFTQVCECAVATREPSVIAVAQFLRAPDVERILREKPDFDPSANIAFQVNGAYPFDLGSVKNYWAKKAAAADDGGLLMQCLVCGEMRPPVERLPIVIKGIPGGQATGLTLISANAAAFESYGLKASLIAPTCEACGERFGNALNDLLRKEETHIVLPPLSYVFWLRDPGADGLNVQKNLMDPEPAEVRELIRSPRRGKTESTNLDETAFYAATLSASGARVVLRDWMETSVSTVRENLKRYFTLQRIQGYDGQIRFFPLPVLINATINRDTQEKPLAQVGEALMRVALHGGQLPMSILHKVVRRIRISRRVQPEQAALIKMVLFSQLDTTYTQYEREDYMTTVSDEETDAPYLCGRLLAQLDYIQHRALGKVNATIVDRFYGTASVSPAVVFPRLLKGAMSHLANIRPEHNGNLKSYSASLSYPDKELARLLEHLTTFPAMLTLEEQGRFALGFYHQKARYLSQTPKPGNESFSISEETNSDTTESTTSEGE
jgi:CRISPR-associated protein Csd1